MGKLLRTIYLCDYFTLGDFRRAIYSVLERGESVHALQRAIHIGAVPVRRGRDLAEFSVVSSALALMTNIVMAYNAGQLQNSVDAELATGIDLADCLRVLEHVGPVSYGHVNFRGTYFFPVERYAARILRVTAQIVMPDAAARHSKRYFLQKSGINPTPVHRAQQCQVRSSDAEPLPQVSPQQRRHHPHRIEKPAANAQKPNLQGKPQLELRPPPLINSAGFFSREPEEHLHLKGRYLPRQVGKCRRPRNVACRLSIAPSLTAAQYTQTKQDQQVIESITRIRLDLCN